MRFWQHFEIIGLELWRSGVLSDILLFTPLFGSSLNFGSVGPLQGEGLAANTAIEVGRDVLTAAP